MPAKLKTGASAPLSAQIAGCSLSFKINQPEDYPPRKLPDCTPDETTLFGPGYQTQPVDSSPMLSAPVDIL